MKVCHDPQTRKYLMQIEIVHQLISLSLESCKNTNDKNNIIIKDEYIKDSSLILHNLANFDISKVYIPGETIKQSKDRRKFMLWGGMIALLYLSTNSNIKEVRDICENINKDFLTIKFQEDLIKVLSIYLKSKTIAKTMQCDEDLLYVPDDALKVYNLDNFPDQEIYFPTYYSD